MVFLLFDWFGFFLVFACFTQSSLSSGGRLVSPEIVRGFEAKEEMHLNTEIPLTASQHCEPLKLVRWEARGLKTVEQNSGQTQLLGLNLTRRWYVQADVLPTCEVFSKASCAPGLGCKDE